ncbi:hypothetical protein BH20ACT2_BH20ACT2_05720 [soil metagenome]
MGVRGLRRTGAAVVAVMLGSLVAGLPPTPAGGAVGDLTEVACPSATVPPARFTDDDGSVHEGAISCVAWWELAQGRDATAFAPGALVTRGQAASFLSRLILRSGGRLAAEVPDAFGDDSGTVHQFATDRLAVAGVIGGRGDGTFGPGATLTRGAMAALLVRAYEARTGTRGPDGPDAFGDDSNSVHEDDIDQAAALGLTRGVTAGRFEPHSPLARGQMASFLARLLQALADADRLGEGPVSLAKADALRPTEDCESLLGTIKQRAIELVGPFGFDGGFGFRDFGVAVPTAPGAPDGAGGEDSAGGGALPRPDFSGTNNQEAGVDEADVVKTDGGIVVSALDGRLQVVDASGATPLLAATLDLGQAYHELLLDGDRALVLSSGGIGLASDSRAPTTSRTTVRVVDLADPARPAVVDTLEVDGSVVGARLVDGVARVVVTTPLGLPFGFPTEPTLESAAASHARNRDLVARSRIQDWIPRARRGGTDEALLDCTRISAPPEFSGLGMLSVLTLDPSGPLDPDGAVGILGGGSTLYASASNLYVATAPWETFAAGEAGPDGQLTQIHAFDITDSTGASYSGSGRVAGSVIGQFAFSEHEGVLRVASTTGQPFFDPQADPTDTRITTLSLAGGALVERGMVSGIGRGESVFAVRFIGDQGYVVTFLRVDPLHVVDLADPDQPKLAGELEIPGFSSYLHPVGDDLLLGVGQDADAEGLATGLGLSLFDVSDPANPTRIAQASVTDGSSSAEYDHRAFLWWAPSSLAVVPLTTYRFDDSTGVQDLFSGAVGFDVTQSSGIGERGRITHQEHASSPEQGYVGSVQRSLVIGDTLYTLSSLGLEGVALDTLAERSWVPFPDPPNPPVFG